MDLDTKCYLKQQMIAQIDISWGKYRFFIYYEQHRPTNHIL
jgi:hypothetical protein